MNEDFELYRTIIDKDGFTFVYELIDWSSLVDDFIAVSVKVSHRATRITMRNIVRSNISKALTKKDKIHLIELAEKELKKYKKGKK